MSLYSLNPQRRRRQVIADLLVAAWLVFWLWQGWNVHGSIEEAARPTERAEQITAGLAGDLTSMGESVGAIPLVGSTMGSLIEAATLKVDQLAVLSGDGTELVRGFAWKAALGVALTPSVLILVSYLPRRWRFRRFARESGLGDPEIHALRAITTQPAAVLHRITPDPVGGWRSRDPQTIHALATWQAAWDGIRLPATETTSPR